MEDIFDGISLEDLENSETGVITPDSLKAPKNEIKKEIKPTTPVDSDLEVEDENAVDLEDLIDDTDASEEKESLDKEKEKGDKEIKTPADKKGSSHSSQDTFTSLSSALIEAGVFSSLSEEDTVEIKDVESLMEAISKQIKANEFSSLTDEQKDYLEALSNGVDTAVYAQRKSSLHEYKALEDSKIIQAPKLARELIRRAYIVDGLSPEKADKFATRDMELETFTTDAIAAKNLLIKYEEDILAEEIETKKQEKQKAIEAEDAKLQALKTKVNEVSDIIPGLKFNSLTKDKVFTSITKAVKVDKIAGPLNEVMDSYKNDENYKLRLHALHVATKGFTDFSKFEKVAKSSAVQKLESQLGTGTQFNGRSGAPNVSEGMSKEDIVKALQSVKF